MIVYRGSLSFLFKKKVLKYLLVVNYFKPNQARLSELHLMFYLAVIQTTRLHQVPPTHLLLPQEFCKPAEETQQIGLVTALLL